MSIRLEINNATKEKIDAKILKTAAKVFGKKMKINKQTVSVAFVDQAKIKKLNQQYRGLNRVTDVLSFADSGQSLGELIICYPQIKRQAKQMRQAIQTELVFIFIHGLLHLVGYDDATDKGRKEMTGLGKKLSNQILITN
ncbi:rRNA maturation RNase YbeY [Candidatus Falkowbacteria bacterium CG10_big_fil_rev_8_21_14_0_10_44_15]|uniref:Endoribonuclease YbeY n=1 Tax=Candidatus Falkowbacteria bacterium CG10_big_fil_rev_8_21_14_0_10_44_15 TaxID=1974569 RepID=A0A2H0V262_9BACT|nr:MAG: rRNA maturation RNase YbeY [Candidatus Falkowbacteria bacterium CG10_big_fil_rev_8_21_14_0_10_44_15]